MLQFPSIISERNLSQISDMLLLNGTLTACPGLVHGKTGLAVFFFHYAQYTHKMLFADYAMTLLSEMLSQIHINSPADYEKGIAGIGVGIDYMIRNKFLVTEDDICEDLDLRMFRAVMYDPWQDFSLYDGLIGYGRYWMTRLSFPGAAKQAEKCLSRIVEWIEEHFHDISKKDQTDVYCFLYNLQKIDNLKIYTVLLKQCQMWDLSSIDDNLYFPRLNNSQTAKIVRMVQHNHYFDRPSPIKIENTLKKMPDVEMEKPPVDMGLLSGYAGEGLLRMTATGQTNHSWMFLL